MPQPRKFDHDEARRRYAGGESAAALARAFGVSQMGMWRVVSPKAPETFKRSRDAFYERRRVPCEVCGKPCLGFKVASKALHNLDGRALCVLCRSKERRERLLFDEYGALVSVRCSHLDCANGERWQSPENFSKGTSFKDVRAGGIHGSCRACQTRGRRDHRQRHREQTRSYDRARYAAKRQKQPA